MIKTTSTMPSSIATVRLSIDCSMNVAGRKIVVSTAMPGSPGASSAIACLDAARDLHGVGAAELLHDQHDARPVVDDRVADQRAGVDQDLAEVGESHDLAVPFDHRHLAELLGPGDRLDVADVEALPVGSTKPPVPTTAPSE